MNTLSLSTAALHVIETYLHLPFPTHRIACPYVNNKSLGLRGALPVSVGKGSPVEIVEEIDILTRRAGRQLSRMDADDLRHFLIDHHIGIDCSGLAYHILDAEVRGQGRGTLGRQLRFHGGIVRRLLTRLHPAKNTNVTILQADQNSRVITLREAKPGDLIIMLGSGQAADRDHVLIVTRTDQQDGALHRIHYIHSLIGPSDTLDTQGVREGVIDITVPTSEDILDQKWTERTQTGDANDTYQKAKSAEVLTLRRLYILDNA